MWKAYDDLSMTEIYQRLNAAGMKISRQSLSKMFSNPFYCGYLRNKLLEGELVKGIHPAIISEDLFLLANKVRKAKYNMKEAKKHRKLEALPLRHIVKCESCQRPLTGYMVNKKKIYYYKCNTPGCKINISAKTMHEQFYQLLSQISLNPDLAEKFKQALVNEIQNHYNNPERAHDKKSLEIKLGEAKANLGKVQERFAIGQISNEIYRNVGGKLEAEIDELASQLKESTINLSNLEKTIKKAILFACNLHETWRIAELNDKEKLVKLVFGNNLYYSKQNCDYRTPEMNKLFSAIKGFSKTYANEKGADVRLLDSNRNCCSP